MSTRERKPDRPAPARALRIGDVARLVGTTPRTIRYYEEIGLLPGCRGETMAATGSTARRRSSGCERSCGLRNLLGVSLEELKTLLAAEDARAAVRAQLKREDVEPGQRRELLLEALGHLDRQLELVNHRSTELAKLKGELSDTRKRVRRKLRELDAHEVGAFPPVITAAPRQGEDAGEDLAGAVEESQQ